jgi:thiol:disulfide interchange protein
MAVPMALTALALIWLLSRQLGTNGIFLGVALALVAAVPLWLIGRQQHSGQRISWAVPGAALLALGAAAIIAPPYLHSGAPEAGEGLAGTKFSEAALASARAANKPVFLYFTADWCLTCKVNEANAIDRAEVKAAFEKAGVETIVGDWTNADPAITRFLETHGRSGVPLYLYYEAGATEPKVLPQVLTPGTLTELVKS